MKLLHVVTFTLVLVGALNWGVVGLTSGGFNPVAALFDGMGLTQVVYILVGASAVVVAATHMKDCKVCGKGKK